MFSIWVDGGRRVEATTRTFVFNRGEISLSNPVGQKTASIQQPLSLEAPPSPLSSRPERIGVERFLCGCFGLEMFQCYPSAG